MRGFFPLVSVIFKFLIFQQKPSHPAIVPILPIKLEYIENSTFNKKTITANKNEFSLDYFS